MTGIPPGSDEYLCWSVFLVKSQISLKFFPSVTMMATGCAVDASGNLKDAAEIVFYESEMDAHAILSPAPCALPSGTIGSSLTSLQIVN